MKTYLFSDPKRAPIVVRNLAEFCDRNGLSYHAMSMVARGLQGHHKGYTRRIVGDVNLTKALTDVQAMSVRVKEIDATISSLQNERATRLIKMRELQQLVENDGLPSEVAPAPDVWIMHNIETLEESRAWTRAELSRQTGVHYKTIQRMKRAFIEGRTNSHPSAGDWRWGTLPEEYQV